MNSSAQDPVDLEAEYFENDTERGVYFEAGSNSASIAQNRQGYGMLKVRVRPTGDEVERYYSLEIALDHAAELLGVPVHRLALPEEARDLGM